MLKPKWRKWALETLVILAIVVGIQLWQARGLPEGPAPALAGALLDGRTASLDETLKAAGGKPVLVAYWATWCPVCKAEDGNIEAISRDRPVLSVAMQSEGPDLVAKHMAERGLTFPTINDPDGALASAWKVRGVPAHFVVDGAGNVRFRVVGYATEWGLRARLFWAENW
jgi:thiol-disulfide isomerase/thioredoxin